MTDQNYCSELEDLDDINNEVDDKWAAAINGKVEKQSVVVRFKVGNMVGLAKHLSKKYGGDPHLFTNAMGDEALADYDEETKKRIASKAHYLALGYYPGDKRNKKSEKELPTLTIADEENDDWMKTLPGYADEAKIIAELREQHRSENKEQNMKIKVMYKGGSGSGNFGHSGRPGKIGGSAEGSGGHKTAQDIRDLMAGEVGGSAEGGGSSKLGKLSGQRNTHRVIDRDALHDGRAMGATLIQVGYEQADSNDEGSVDFDDAVRIAVERGDIQDPTKEHLAIMRNMWDNEFANTSKPTSGKVGKYTAQQYEDMAKLDPSRKPAYPLPKSKKH